MECISTSVIGEMQITTMRYHHTYIRTDERQKLTIHQGADEDAGQQGLSFTGEHKVVYRHLEKSLAVSYKVKYRLKIHNPTPRYLPM